MLKKSKLILLLSCQLCLRASYFIILPILPFVIRDAGLTEEFTGYVFGAFGIGPMLGSLVAGKAMSYFSRKCMLLTCFIGFALLYLPVGTVELIEDKNRVGYTLLAARLVQGFFAGAAFTTTVAMLLVDAEDDEERQNLNILRLVVDILGLLFGPIIGALIYSVTTSFLHQALASFAVAALLCLAIGFMDDNQVQETASTNRLDHITYCRLLKIPRVVLGAIGGTFVLIFTLQYFESVMSYIFEKEHQLDKIQIGYIFCLIPVGVFAAIYPSMLLAKHMTKRFVLMMTMLFIVFV